jgi:nucleotide-binding universal stress UspA family protein
MHRNVEPEPIIVAVDGSPHSDAAVKWAARESVLRKASVTLVHVITPMPDTLADAAARSNVDRWYKDNANTVVAAAEALFRAAHGQSSVVDVRTAILEAPVLPTLVDVSAKAQLIVVGSRGQTAMGRLLMGSVSTSLVHHAQCPVAVIPLDETRRALDPYPVLLGVDGTAASERRDRRGLRRGRSALCWPGGRARMERRRRSAHHRQVVRLRDRRHRTVGRTPRRLVGEVPRRDGHPTCCLRRPGTCNILRGSILAARRGRKPRSRRFRRTSAGLSGLRRRARVTRTGHRCSRPLMTSRKQVT